MLTQWNLKRFRRQASDASLTKNVQLQSSELFVALEEHVLQVYMWIVP